jgi:hypothetical protein
MSWRPFTDATSYKLYRHTDAGAPLTAWTLIAAVDPSYNEYVDAEAFDLNQRYFYAVVVVY